MLTLKINITKFIKQDEKDRIFKYSKTLAECYNLVLNHLKTNNDFNAIHPLTKAFQNQHKEINSKHAQNCGKEAINAVKSFFKLRKIDNTAKYPKNNRKYSVINLDANKQIRILKSGEKVTSLGGGFKFTENKVIKFTYPQLTLDLSQCNYFNPQLINKESIKQIIIKIEYPRSNLCLLYLF